MRTPERSAGISLLGQHPPHPQKAAHTTGVFARSKPASEAGIAIRRRERNSPRRQAANIPPRNQNQEKGKRRREGLLAFHRLPSFRIPQEAAAGARARDPPGTVLAAAFTPQPRLPKPTFAGGGRDELGLRPGRRQEAEATRTGNTTKLNRSFRA